MAGESSRSTTTIDPVHAYARTCHMCLPLVCCATNNKYTIIHWDRNNVLIGPNPPPPPPPPTGILAE